MAESCNGFTDRNPTSRVGVFCDFSRREFVLVSSAFRNFARREMKRRQPIQVSTRQNDALRNVSLVKSADRHPTHKPPADGSKANIHPQVAEVNRGQMNVMVRPPGHRVRRLFHPKSLDDQAWGPSETGSIRWRSTLHAESRRERSYSSPGIMAREQGRYPEGCRWNGARGRNRTVTPLSGPGILSPVRLPVSPPGHVETQAFNVSPHSIAIRLWRRTLATPALSSVAVRIRRYFSRPTAVTSEHDNKQFSGGIKQRQVSYPS